MIRYITYSYCLDFWSSNVFCGFQGVPFGMLLVTLLALVITLAQRALQPLLAVLEALIALAIALVIFLWRQRSCLTPLMKSHARFLEQLSHSVLLRQRCFRRTSLSIGTKTLFCFGQELCVSLRF